MIVKYNKNGNYTLKFDGWSLTGDLMFLESVSKKCFNKSILNTIKKEIYKNVK